MKKITLVLLSTILAGCCKMPNFVGKTFILPKNWQSELTFYPTVPFHISENMDGEYQNRKALQNGKLSITNTSG